MAESDETMPEPGRPAETRRKRPPVTIDLAAEAEPSSGAQPEPAAEAPSSDPEVGAPPLSDAPRRADAAKWLPILAAAVLGGVVGGLITAFLAAPQTDMVTQASIDSRFSALASRLDKVEAEAAQAPAASPVDDSRLAALESEITALKSAPAGEPGAPAPSVDLSPLETRVAALENRSAPASSAPVDLGPLETRLGALSARIDAVEANPPADPKTEAAARTIALTSLKQAGSVGGPFETELEALAALGADTASLSDLTPLAKDGAPSLAALQAAFPAIADQIRASAMRVDPEAGLWSRLAASAGSLVTVKPAGPVEGSSPTAILSRMEAAVAAGNLQAALTESEALDAAERAPLAAWAENARRRIAIDAALARLAPASNG